MRKRKTFIAMALVIAILILGVGYAAISNITLNINGTANVTANADFVVEFDQDHTVAGTNATGTYTNSTTATMTVDLDSSKKVATAVYKIDNNSSELSAKLSATVKNDDTSLNKYVEITTEFCSDATCVDNLNGPVTKESSAYLKVTANLKNNPAQDVTNKLFTITITATPEDSN